MRSAISIVVPSGQSHPQKNLPSNSVIATRIIEYVNLAIRVRDASMVAKAPSGSSLRMKSTGMVESAGYTVRSERDKKKSRNII
jgi:hypothetical protein